MCELANAATRYSAASRIRCNYGMRGFGVYSALVGLIEANPTRRIRYDLPSICWELREEEEYVKKIVEDFDLFIIDDGYLIDAFSQTPEIKEREAQEEKRRRRSEAAKKGAATRKARAQARQNQTPTFLTQETPQPASEPVGTTVSVSAAKPQDDGIPWDEYDDGYEGGVPMPNYVPPDAYYAKPCATDEREWKTFVERFDRIRKYWNDLFINSNRPKRAYIYDPTSMMKEYLKETFAQFTDEEIEKAFKYAAQQDFTWEFRFTIKAKNIRRLLSEAEQEEWKMVNDLTIEQRELMQYAQDEDILNWNYLRSEGRGRDIQWLPKDYYQRQQQ